MTSTTTPTRRKCTRCGKRRSINQYRPRRGQCRSCEAEIHRERRAQQDKLNKSLALLRQNRAANAEQRRRDAAAAGIYWTDKG